MAWNVHELKMKIADLEKKCETVTDPTTLYGLNNDLNNLKTMINYKLGYELYEIKLNPYQILDYYHYNEMIEALADKGRSYVSSLYWILQIHHIPSKITLPRRINELDYQELLYDFLDFFDKNLLQLYKEYTKENRIEINPRYYDNKTCRGRCFILESEGKSYIASRYNRWFSMISNIPHELGHAYQFNEKKDTTEIQRCLYSLFGEAYPIFIEYAFLDYMQDTKYLRHAYNEQASLIDNFLCNLEYNVDSLSSVPTLEYDSEEKIIFQRFNGTYTLLLSNMLAMYWYYLYKIKPTKALEDIAWFNERYGTIAEGELLEKYSAPLLSKGVRWTIDKFTNKQ